MNKYIGHSSQLYGVEEHKIVGGMGDGMHIFSVRNGKGLEFTICADRAADISRLYFKGVNMGYFAPCGYVSSTYYDRFGSGFFKSFYAGFMTTCGLENVGVSCEDDGEELPIHGSISNIPAEHIWWCENDDEIIIYATVKDERLFSHKFVLNREIHCSLEKNIITVKDRITNCGDKEYPVMILYHLNMGYPLLCENSILEINSVDVTPRNEHAKSGINEWNKIISPQINFEEQCYFHKFKDIGIARLYNPDINVGIEIRFDSKNLCNFTEWKMMGIRDYALGLEPANCLPLGRKEVRKDLGLRMLNPGDSAEYSFDVILI